MAHHNNDLQGVPEGIRTPDLRFRKPLLYPAELPGQMPDSRRLTGRPADRRQGTKRRSAPRFQIKTDCLRPVTDIEFAKEISQMKFDRID